MKRLLFSMALSLGVVLSWAQYSGSGSGTSSDPYRIYNADQLNEVRNFLNQSGVYFKLMSDIDLTQWISANNPGQGWEPIGTSSATFQGVFDGNNKTLTGFSINRTTNYVGFFGYTSGATVKKLTIVGNVKGGQYTGAFVGKAESGTLSGLTHQGTTNGTGYTGGIVGCASASISSATVTGNVTATGDYAGGIVGDASNSISNATIEGNVTATSKSYVGGIAGQTTGNITTASVTGNMTGGTYTGGLVGKSSSGTLNGLSYVGLVSGSTSVGGVVGYAKSATISHAHVSHTVTGTGDKVGGVCGSAEGTEFSNCYSYCNITGQSYTGGIVGQLLITFSKNINNCLSFGNINGTGYVGGIAGAFNCEKDISTNVINRNIIINNCGAIGNIVASGDNVGGIAGCLKSRISNLDQIVKTTVSNCYFNGSLEGAECVGGIAGIAYSAEIIKNYSNADIQGTSYVGGIVGVAQDVTTDNSFNSILKSNMSMNSTISTTSTNSSGDTSGRIHGFDGAGVTYGTIGTNEDNRALYDTRVIRRGVTVTVPDNDLNGVSNGVAYFKLRANYVAHGWDFNNDWTNLETESYPYKSWQTAPPTFPVKPKSGDTSISVQSVDGGTVYVKVGDNSETSVVCSGNAWELTGLSPLNTGEELSAYTKTSNKENSYITKEYAAAIGSGTESDPWLIYTAYDLQGAYQAGYYKLMNDLDLTSWINDNSSTAGWIPVGFSGSGNFIFDGDNHTISGLWVNSTENYAGLFSSLRNATIKNVTVIASTRKVKGGNYTGILAGNLSGTNVENVTVQGDVQGGSYVGGVFGRASALNEGDMISNVSFEGNVNSTGTVGGIVGYASLSLNNCTAQATLTSSGKEVGGIVGLGMYILDQCCYTGSISSSASNALVGGLAGSASGGYLTENGANYNIRMCKADVTISATGTGSKCGGLVGGDTGAMILQSTASGTITASGSDSYAGGLVGYLSSGSVMNCYSTANTSSTLYAAGLVGYNEKSAITKCYASGNVNSTYYGAGVVGYNDGANATLTNSVAMGTIVNVNDQSGWSIRVLGGYKNSAPQSDNSNFGWSGMQISVNGVPKTINDNELDGLSLSTAQTKQSATYTAIDWDFNDIWTIEEGVGYPKLKWEGETGPTVVLATGVTLDQTSITLITAGQTATLTATVEPADVTDGSVSWTSSDISVATVSSEGVVTAVANGTATITATTNDGSNLTATCTVTVNITTTVLATGVTLSQSSITLTNAGETATLTATVAPGNVTDGSVTWTSSDETVATVNGEGVVTAVANGSATITVTTNDGTNLTATCTITVAIPEDNPDPDTDISQIANVVYMESTEVSAGSEETLSIKMKNTVGIQTLQFDLYLPEGVEVLLDEDDFELIELSTERTTARKMDQFSVQQISNGAYRVLINSSRGYTFDGTDGEIVTVQVGVSGTMTPGNYPVIFRDIVLVTTSSVGYETAYVKCSLNIPDYKPGDVNNDNKVNAIDLNAITNYILERRDFPFTFNKKAANINGDKETNGDEKINAIDLNAVTNMILNEGATTSSANRRRGILIPD